MTASIKPKAVVSTAVSAASLGPLARSRGYLILLGKFSPTECKDQKLTGGQFPLV